MKDEKKEIAEEGKAVLARKLKAQKIQFNEKSINELVVFFNLKTSLDLFYRVGIGKIDNQLLKDFANSRSNSLVSYFKSKIKKPQVAADINKDEITAKYDQLVFGKEEEKLDYKLANCCNPIPGDTVFGFISVNDGIKVHKKDCPNALQLQSNYAYRIIQAKWIDSSQQDFQSVIKLQGIDNLGLVSEITKEISSNLGVNMKNLNFDSSDGIFNGRITLVVKNNNNLNTIIQRLKKINGIDKVSRE